MCGVDLGAVLEIAEYDDSPLPPGQATDGVPELTGFDGQFDGSVRWPVGERVRRSLASPALPPPGDGRGHQDPAYIRLRIPLDPLPGKPRLGQRRLQQVLSQLEVPDQAIGRAEQRW